MAFNKGIGSGAFWKRRYDISDVDGPRDIEHLHIGKTKERASHRRLPGSRCQYMRRNFAWMWVGTKVIFFGRDFRYIQVHHRQTAYSPGVTVDGLLLEPNRITDLNHSRLDDLGVDAKRAAVALVNAA